MSYELTPLAQSIVERAASQLAPESETVANYVRHMATAIWEGGAAHGMKLGQEIVKTPPAPCVACKGRGEVWKRDYAAGEWQEICAECNGTGVTL